MPLLIAFSGQGTQYGQMFHLLSEDAKGQQWLRQASTLLDSDLFDPLIVEQGCQDVILAQCLIVILEMGVFNLIIGENNLQPDLLCGYSLGEVAAFAASVQLTMSELYSLTHYRAQIMQQITQQSCGDEGAGLAVLKGNITAQTVQRLTDKHGCYLAIVNGDDHFIIGGKNQLLDDLLSEARTAGVKKAKGLAVRLPSHTPLLAKASQKFEHYLQSFVDYPMHYPVLNSLNQQQIMTSRDMIKVLAAELSQTLQWGRLMPIAKEYGITTMLELGPRAALKTMFKSTVPKIQAYAMDEFASIGGLLNFMKARE